MFKFPEIEKRILKYWGDKKIFKKNLEKTKSGKRFVFFEGPPTANGQPGIHHVLARAYKDAIPRYKTMQGFYVERKAGWDTHGLPVELEVEKALKISGKPDIEKFGIEKFNDECKASVWEYKKDWEEMTERLGFWIDMENPYVTYDNNYIESVWWILKQIWDKNLLYRGYKVVPHCPRCGTALSSHEVAQGYESVTEPSVYIKFKLVKEKNTYVLAWTTTSWTLPGNVSLALGEHITYVKVFYNKTKEYYILAKDRLDILKGKYKVIEELDARDLKGKKYEPLFHEFLNLEKITGKKAYYLSLADFVTVDEGTGVVHTAVMYGEDDYNLGEKINLPKFHTVDENGHFTKEVVPWAKRFVKDKKLDREIIEYLKKKNLLLSEEDYTHDYPFCWRCSSPLLYYAKDSWFIRMSSLRDKLKENNEGINWIPDFIKYGRFGEWLNEVKDWAISRERYWGTPLPIWQCEACEKYRCLGSKKELLKDIDLHRPYVDGVELDCDCGGKMRRVPEVIDCWFDSGSMPFAQWHYPFENKERIDKGINYPADYISEAIDQTRGWFYTLLAISTLLDKGLCYKNVICLGLVMDKDGQKMSKSRGNIVLPKEIFDKYGADAIRWYLYTINQPGETKNFDEQGIEEVVKKVFIVLFNVLDFYKMYAAGHKNDLELKVENILDKWIVSKLNLLIKEVTYELENYQITNAARKSGVFISELSTWYLRRSRLRFKGEDKSDKESALATLHYILLNLSKLMAPFTPFLAEEIYRTLKGGRESVHLEDWPKYSEKINGEILQNMVLVRQVVELGHALRAESGIKVRQPLGQIIANIKNLEEDYVGLIKDELNVKEVHLKKTEVTGADFASKEGYGFKVMLDKSISDELREEGVLRELVRSINSLRKKAGLTIKDKVLVGYHTEDRILEGLCENYKSRLLKEVLATDIQKLDKKEILSFDFHQDVKINQIRILIGFNKK